ncbi:MAG TPA: aerobic carbon-monoxide dehydrogenase large subunit [Acidimicrobiia bacterium]|nr:aerobic carbon-monoxide dehydrogenase large subunit [Acidimicrobiia bacterium]
MTTTAHPHRTTIEVGGLGHSVKRKEDDRFIQGAGTYLDDFVLPGMLHMAIVRSPIAHGRVVSIDTSAAMAVEGVVAVITGEALAAHNLAWMPTLSGDTQAVLATDKVRYQGQEVAAVIASDPYVARDAAVLVDVEYEDLPAITTPQQALADGAVLIRDEKEGQTDNLVYEWETGNKETTDRAFAEADLVVSLDTHYPRSHPAPLETCGALADVNPATGQATIYLTSQAPHAHRTLFAIVAGLPEEKIRIISPDIGGGFGNKVPIYPGYVVATAASLLIGKPVKWIESRYENLISTGFARDYHMKGEMALTKDGRITAMRASILSDQGAFFADAQPTKFRAGLFHICTGSYDIPTAHVSARGAFTNKAPGGVAYRCSFRVTEASYLVERLAEDAAWKLGMDPADFRRLNFIDKEQFPYHSATGFVYDSGDYHAAMDEAMALSSYSDWRQKQAAGPTADGKLIGIGLASFTEVVGAGNSREWDIAGLKMIDSAELRVHPTGKAILKLGVKSQGQGHETTFAQIVAEELGIPFDHIKVMEGDTDNTPYGLGTYASRSTPVGGAATAMVARTIREKARKIAAHLLEAAEDDLDWEPGKFTVRGTDSSVTIQDIAFAAYTNFPEGMQAGLEGVHYYDPPNMTYPFGTYVVVVEVDPADGTWKVAEMTAVDDCGVRINPMIVEGQITGGLTEGFAKANMQWITFDDNGNCIGANFLDYLVPTAYETPKFRLGQTVTPSPHHPLGAKGVGESATVGSPAAFVNAVLDALRHSGLDIANLDMPVLPHRVWGAINGIDVKP